MGGIVGGLHAAGLTAAKLTEMLGGLRADDFTDTTALPKVFGQPKNLFEYILLSDYKNRFFGKFGLDQRDAIESYLKSCVGRVRIEDLPSSSSATPSTSSRGGDLFTRGPLISLEGDDVPAARVRARPDGRMVLLRRRGPR